MPSRLRAAR